MPHFSMNRLATHAIVACNSKIFYGAVCYVALSYIFLLLGYGCFQLATAQLLMWTAENTDADLFIVKSRVHQKTVLGKGIFLESHVLCTLESTNSPTTFGLHSVDVSPASDIHCALFPHACCFCNMDRGTFFL